MRALVFSFIFFISLGNIFAQENSSVSFAEKFRLLLDKKEFQSKLDYQSIRQEVIVDINNSLQLEFDEFVRKDNFHQLINAYNFLVIKSVSEHYPIASVNDIPQFFTKEHPLGIAVLNLDNLEKLIIESSGHPEYHLLLNCGARSCPPLLYIDETKELSEYVQSAFIDKIIVNKDELEKKYMLSKVFYWKASDFTSESDIKTWLSKFINIEHEYTLDYQEYDWSLNDLNSDAYLIYYPTKLFRKGGYEFKIFNNYYTQSDNGLRSNFFTSFIQLMIGTNKRLNFGLDVKLRSVNSGDIGLFSALNFKHEPYLQSNGVSTFSRVGISGIGPRVKYQPFKEKANINILHSVYFVPMANAEGDENFGYSDFGHIQIYNNLYFEKELSAKRRLFFDFGFHIENIRLGAQRNFDHFMQVQLPVTTIYSFYPNPQTTFYGLANVALRPVFNYAPDTDTNLDISGYAQIGGGAKYYLTPFLEIEGLYTYFLDGTPGRQAHTFNIGLRFFKQ